MFQQSLLEKSLKSKNEMIQYNYEIIRDSTVVEVYSEFPDLKDTLLKCCLYALHFMHSFDTVLYREAP